MRSITTGAGVSPTRPGLNRILLYITAVTPVTGPDPGPLTVSPVRSTLPSVPTRNRTVTVALWLGNPTTLGIVGHGVSGTGGVTPGARYQTGWPASTVALVALRASASAASGVPCQLNSWLNSVRNTAAANGMTPPIRNRRGVCRTVHGAGGSAPHLRFKNGAAGFTGAEAERIASIILPKVNRFGGSKEDVALAVQLIEYRGDSEHFLRDVGRLSGGLIKSMTGGVSPRKAKMRLNKYGLFCLPAPERLAIEMALHEEAERRALEGELAALERAWADAEEVAGIADNLLVSDAVEAQFRKLKGED